MKSIVFFAFIFSWISNNTLSGQNRACSLVENRLLQVVDLNDGSKFLAKSFRDTELITRLDEGGNLLWQKEIKVQFPDTFLAKALSSRETKEKKGYLVTSNDGSNAFFIEMHVGFFGKSSAHVTHFNELGEMRSFDFQDKNKVMGESLQSTFCDNAYLYFLATEKNSHYPNNKSDLNYILNRFSIADFKFEPLVLDLPALEEQAYQSDWTFAGQKDGEKYLFRKTASTLENTLHGKVVSFDANGTLIKSFAITSQPAEHFIRPSNHIARKNWNTFLNTNNDYYNSIGTSPSTSKVNYRIGAYFNLLLDEKTGEIYISGLMGNDNFGKNPLKFQNQAYNGFYIKKFDQEGNELWDFDHTVDGKTFHQDDFVKRFPPGYKNTHLAYLPKDGLLNFTIQVKDKLINFAINEKGNLLGQRKKEFFQQAVDNTVFIPEDKGNEEFGFISFQELRPDSESKREKESSDPKSLVKEGPKFSKQRGMVAY